VNSIQYTIRAIPTKLDKVLRQQSRATGKSLNEVVIATLEKGTGINTHTTFSDLDWFIGAKSLPDSFNKDMDWLDSLPRDM
jgi:hypothetical protein